MKLYPYTGTWDANDARATLKADVAHYTSVDPLPSFYGLSQRTGIPVTCLMRYVLAKYAASDAAMQATEPLLLQLLDKEIAAADAADSDAALLPAYATKQEIFA